MTAAFLIGVFISPVVFGAGTAKAEPDSAPCTTEPPVGQQGTLETTDPTAQSPAATDVPAAPPVEAAVVVVPHARFNEVLPDPSGADDQGEFIEIANPDDADADLTGWKIENAAGKKFAIAARLGPKALYAFTYAETKIALVNAGMTLTLRDPNGNAADTLTYAGPAKTAKSFARAEDGSWQWTSTPTPGVENGFDPPAQEDASSSTTGAETPSTPAEPVATSAAETTVGATASSASPSPSADDPAQHVSIVEIMPDPPGDDAGEWIALMNDGQTEARLDGLSLDDADGGSAPFSLAGIRIPAKSRVRIARADSKLALNNDGDSVRLLGPDGAPRQIVTFGIVPEGKTYAFVDGGWKWLPEDVAGDGIHVSGAAASALPAALLPTDDGTSQADAAEQPVQASVSDVSPDDDSLLEVEGIVTLPPGVVGKRTFAMQDPADLDGMFVRAYGSGAMPQLAAGDRVRVVGRATRNLPSRFATTGARIRKVAAGTPLFEERALAGIGDDSAGAAVAVTGIVTRRGESVLSVADEKGRTEIAVRAVTGGTFATTFMEGATVAARGVVRVRAGKIELLVTEKDGVTPVAGPAAKPRGGTPPVVEKGPAGARLGQPERPAFGYAAEKPVSGVAVGGIIAAAAAIAAFMVRRRRSAELERLAVDR